MHGKTNAEVKRLADLEDVREYLVRQGRAVWKIVELDGEMEGKLEFENTHKYSYPSSR